MPSATFATSTSNILDLIDNAIADDDSVSGDAMRWAPNHVSKRATTVDASSEPTCDGGMFLVGTDDRAVRVTMLTYQLERPDGAALYRWTVPSTYAIHGIRSELGGALRVGLNMIRPPWRLRLYRHGKWGTIMEVAGNGR